MSNKDRDIDTLIADWETLANNAEWDAAGFEPHERLEYFLNSDLSTTERVTWQLA